MESEQSVRRITNSMRRGDIGEPASEWRSLNGDIAPPICGGKGCMSSRPQSALRGWRRNDEKVLYVNHGDLTRRRGDRPTAAQQQGQYRLLFRSQSAHSSKEASNDGGAKGRRKVDA